MTAAIILSDRIDASAIIEMHEALLSDSAPAVVGRWRDEQVWIGGGSVSPHSAAFVPPHHDRVDALMTDLIAFMERTDVPALAQAAIAHAQFETIHPFPDGNGRTGRALIQAMLRAGRVTQNTTVPVSAGLLHDPDAYFGALDAYRDGHPEAIVEAVAEAAFVAINNGRKLVVDIREAAARWNTVVNARSDSSVHRLKEYLLSQPVVNVKTVAEALAVSEIAAAGSITRLEESGILAKTSGDARNRLWQAAEILDALDAFAARARRARH